MENERKKNEKERKILAEERKKSEEKIKKLAANKKSQQDTISASSGTGFFVTNSGHIVSNNHVVDSCSAVKVHYKGDVSVAKILAVDRSNDLALMKIDSNTNDFFNISNEDATLMTDIYVAGYPFGQSVSSSIKVTKGVVSGLSGLGDNYSNMQIDAALQPGNSGGPIFTKEGDIVGVAVSKLDYAIALKTFGSIPENINFGIKSSVVKAFVKSNNIKLPERDMTYSEDVGSKIQNATVYLDCWMTAAKIEAMKTKKTFFPGVRKGFDFMCYNSCKGRNDESFCVKQCTLE